MDRRKFHAPQTIRRGRKRVIANAIMSNLVDVYATKVRRKGGYYYFVRGPLDTLLSGNETLTTLDSVFNFCRRHNYFLRALK